LLLCRNGQIHTRRVFSQPQARPSAHEFREASIGIQPAFEAAGVLGLDYWQTEAFLKERGVPLNYSASDLETDNATLDKTIARS
jgi:hypothetical protein